MVALLITIVGEVACDHLLISDVLEVKEVTLILV